jgi:hypothetical protein
MPFNFLYRHAETVTLTIIMMPFGPRVPLVVPASDDFYDRLGEEQHVESHVEGVRNLQS